MTADTLAPARAPLPEPSRPPCPFCGSKAFSYPQCRDRMWHVWCITCGANGPTADSREQALAAWARAQQQPALPADVREAMWAACYEMRAAANAGCLPLSLADDLSDSAARLRELAGEP